MEEKTKLEELRREAKLGEKAYSLEEAILIEDDAALDRFFSEVAQEADEILRKECPNTSD